MMHYKKLLILIILLVSSIIRADSYLVVHGLNASPWQMKDIVNLLKESGHKVKSLRLTGHGKNAWEEFLNVEKSKWEQDFKDAYLKLTGRKHLIAYSLGGVVSLYAQKRNPWIMFDSQLLFAPAVVTRSYAKLIKVVDMLGIEKLPSFAPTKEKVHSYTPTNAYMAMFDMQDEVSKLGKSMVSFNKTKTTIMIDPSDKLVSFSGIKQWLKNNHLDTWKVEELEGKRSFGHMIILKEFMNKKSWSKILKYIGSEG